MRKLTTTLLINTLILLAITLTATSCATQLPISDVFKPQYSYVCSTVPVAVLWVIGIILIYIVRKRKKRSQ